MVNYNFKRLFEVDKQIIDRDFSVFINCPFDHDYSLIFDAIVFSTICCGFLPRCAVESGTASAPRINRIASAIFSSRYSIHDLSRSQGEGDMNYARFNMPLELGIAMACQFQQQNSEIEHDWLALVPVGHSYKQFISDLSGYDPKEYTLSVESVVPAVMSWLATRPHAISIPTPDLVLTLLSNFEKKKEMYQKKWKGQLPWSHMLKIAMETAAKKIDL